MDDAARYTVLSPAFRNVNFIFRFMHMAWRNSWVVEKLLALKNSSLAVM